MRTNILLALAVAMSASIAQSALLTGVTSDNQLLEFDTSSPSVLVSGKPISGLGTNENILGIDYRPTDSKLYALGSFGNLYTIDKTGPVATATPLFNLNTPPGPSTPGYLGLSGTSFGFDFNPVNDYAGTSSLRVVSNTDQNLAVNVGTMSVTQATPVFYTPVSPANIAAQAYNNTFFGAAGGPGNPDPTTGDSFFQFAIDSGTDRLVTQAFNAGTLTDVGPLGVNVNSLIGFDIISSSNGNFGFASLDPDGNSSSNLYFINLLTGAATDLGEIDGGVLVPHLSANPGAPDDFDILGDPIPEPSALGLAGLALAAIAFRSRKRRVA